MRVINDCVEEVHVNSSRCAKREIICFVYVYHPGKSLPGEAGEGVLVPRRLRDFQHHFLALQLGGKVVIVAKAGDVGGTASAAHAAAAVDVLKIKTKFISKWEIIMLLTFRVLKVI